MADNVAITAGVGTNVAADDIGSVFFQRVKLALGADGAGVDAEAGAGAVSTAVQRVTLASDDPAVTAVQLIDDTVYVDDTATHSTGTSKGIGIMAAATPTDTSVSANDIGMLAMSTARAMHVQAQASTNNIGDVDIASITAGETHVGEVGGKSIVYNVTLSTDTAAYASGDLIADTQQLDAFFRKADGTGVINSITIVDEEAQNLAFYIIFMKTSTSLGSENSAPNISDANFSAGCQGIVRVSTTDWITVSGTSVCTIRNIGLPVKAVSGTDDLYIAVLNATGAPDWDADSLVVNIGALLD